MDRLAHVPEAQAFLRTPKGIYKQVDVYRRGEYAFVPFGGGWVRLCPKVGDSWPTSTPTAKVVELDIPDFNPTTAKFSN